MSVQFSVGRPLEEQAMRYAMAGLIVTRKQTRQATERCRKRMGRAVAFLERDEPVEMAPHSDPRVGAAAALWLRRTCDLCRLCPGVRLTPPPSG